MKTIKFASVEICHSHLSYSNNCRHVQFGGNGIVDWHIYDTEQEAKEFTELCKLEYKTKKLKGYTCKVVKLRKVFGADCLDKSFDDIRTFAIALLDYRKKGGTIDYIWQGYDTKLRKSNPEPYIGEYISTDSLRFSNVSTVNDVIDIVQVWLS